MERWRVVKVEGCEGGVVKVEGCEGRVVKVEVRRWL